MHIPETPPATQEILQQLVKAEKLNTLLLVENDGAFFAKYYHWDDLKYRTPPDGFSRETWWLSLKLRRLSSRRTIPLLDKKDTSFWFSVPDLATELLHQIDRDGGTLIQISEAVTNPNERDRYVVHSLMEEAITSSQLEGAATTRAIAKKMLADGRKPRDRSERMIFNNYATMRRIMELKDEPLTPDFVLKIHRLVSENTLDIADGAGRLRRADEAVEVSDEYGTVFHAPPPAAELPERLQKMCEFANAASETNSESFIHPVIRAIILHFWLAYDHPFVDGNGRTARALFYWHMLHSGYWLFEFISISNILHKAPAKYGEAFLKTETDGNDLTYFILHQAEVIRRALQELHDFVKRKSREMRTCMKSLGQFSDLNHRQQALLAHAIRHPHFIYNIAGHMNRQQIAYETARRDLLDLANRELLEQSKQGNAFIFRSPADLEKRLGKSD